MNRLTSTIALLAACSLTACGGGDDKNDSNVGSTSSALIAAPTLNTYVNKSLEIDQLVHPGLAPEDANLFVGDDPADGTASNQVPTGGPADFIDWDDVNVTNHRLLDVDDSRDRDPTSFPRSNECVAPSKVLSKMDLRYVAAANNNKYAYFAVVRANNNGDAGYYWLFTKAQPKMIAGGGPCKSTEEQLVYDIQEGDVLLGGHFAPSNGPLMTVYRATQTLNDVTAVDAINFDSNLWEEVQGAVEAVAVNTTTTAPGAFGSDGVVAMDGDNLEEELFAEAAINLSAFTGEGSHCGATYYGSVVTRPSGAGGTSPDLKDLAGPALFNFGSTTASATLEGSCVGELKFSATAVGADGQPIVGAECAWQFSNGMTSNQCSGVLIVDPGEVSGKVTVADAVSSCQDVASTPAATIAEPLQIELNPVGDSNACVTDEATYVATVSGGVGGEVVVWSGADCAGTSCTINPDDSLLCTDVSLSATVSDPTGQCVSATSETETYSKVTTVSVSNN